MRASVSGRADFTAHLLVFVVMAIVVVPLATTQALFRSQDQEGRFTELGVPDLHERAKSDRQERHERRLRFYEAMELYRERLKDGEQGLTKPDINDPGTVDFYLEEEKEAAVDKSAASDAPAPSTLQVDQVSEYDRSLLRRYERAQHCPESLKNYTPGFYELCLSLVGEAQHEAPRMGLLNDLLQTRVKVRNVLPNTFQTRMEMLRQARDRSTRIEGPKPSTVKEGE